jgi:acetyltransferase-like isoleucine patch superfamily enzyme
MDFGTVITDHTWILKSADGRALSEFILFVEPGRILGYYGIDQSSWVMLDGCLAFLNQDGDVTAHAEQPVLNPDGRYQIKMVGTGPADGTTYLLFQRDDIPSLLNFSSYETIIKTAKKHPAFENDSRMGESGFSKPEIEDLEIIEVRSETIPRLQELGIEIVGAFSFGNFFVVDRNMPPNRLKIYFNGGRLNTIILDRKACISGVVRFEGHENLIVAGNAAVNRTVNIVATLRYSRAGLFLGKLGSIASVNLWVEGPGRLIQIGDEHLFSWAIWVRTADSHALIDLPAGKKVNSSKSITIGRHVWLGQDVLVMGGVEIGAGSVIGARSIVTKSVPPTSVAAGIPARVVRRDASWTLGHNPSDDEISALKAQFLDG